jgi:hypothetical protein
VLLGKAELASLKTAQFACPNDKKKLPQLKRSGSHIFMFL